MLLSVTVPVYNGAKFLPTFLPQLDNQKDKDFEAIFVNDGSTDETAELLAGRNVHTLTKNSGLCGAINYGHTHARGDYLTWWAVDDVYYPSCTAVLKRLIGESNAADLVLTSFDSIVGGKVRRCKRLPFPVRGQGNLQLGRAFAYKRELWNKVRYQVQGIEDVDFLYRCLFTSPTVHAVDLKPAPAGWWGDNPDGQLTRCRDEIAPRCEAYMKEHAPRLKELGWLA